MEQLQTGSIATRRASTRRRSTRDFTRFVLHPYFDARLGHLSFDYESAYGPIHSDWTVEGNAATWHVTIPPNATGMLPVDDALAARYTLGGVPLNRSPLAHKANRNGQSGYALEPGRYTIHRRSRAARCVRGRLYKVSA